HLPAAGKPSVRDHQSAACCQSLQLGPSDMGSSVQGTLKAATDLKQFGNDWIEFGWVNGLTVAGGTIDGQGAASWPFNKCPVRKDCKVLPTVSSIFFFFFFVGRSATLLYNILTRRTPRHGWIDAAERAVRQQPEHGCE